MTYAQIIRPFVFALFLGGAAASFADEEVLASQQLAEQRHLPPRDVKEGWCCVSRGGDFYFSRVVREYDMDGNNIGGSFFFNSTKHAGAVAAVPIGDFKVLERFRYRGAARNGGPASLDGLLVSVEVQISAGNGTPAPMVMQRAVENMVKSGLPLPAATGAKPGRLLSLLESAKRRYGARLAKPRYDGKASKVLILLLDCQADLSDETYLPATLQGATRAQRLAQSKKLEKGADMGGSRSYSEEVEVIPVGSRRIPFNGACD